MSRGKTRFCWDISQGNRNSAPVRRDRAAARSWHGAAVTEGLSAETMVIISSRLTASQSLTKGLGLYGSPPGRFFCSCKRNQNRAKGNRAFPFANPFDAWLRWIRILFFCWYRKTNPYCAQMRSKGSLRRHFYRPRAGARRANHHPSPLLKGGELCRQWTNTF